MQVVGQKNNLEIIDKWETLPNFLIIQGDKHFGKSFLALYLCKKFGLHYMQMGNSVKNVRQLVTKMVKDSNTLYHFKDFETATLQAKNALLKITEEPVRGNYIVITGGPQIKTLESRARRIIMEPFSYEDIKPLLLAKYKPEICEDLYYCGINTPAKIEYYKGYDKFEGIIGKVKLVFSKLTTIEPEDGIELMSKFEDRYDTDKIDGCKLFLNMLISYIEYNIKIKYFYSYLPILRIIIKYKDKLSMENTLRRKLLILRMFNEISNCEGLVKNERAENIKSRSTRK